VSLSEFQSIVGTKSSDRDALAYEASRLAATGVASMIALTLGERGAILAMPERHITLPAIPVEAQSGVGAGDSFLAGLVLGLARRQTAEEALRFAIATSATAVMSRGTARVTRQQVETLLVGALAQA
jgi:6-phosphofructokinase 2